MRVVVDIPDSVASQLQSAQKNPARSLLEAFAAEAYRSGQLSRGQVQRMLGLDFYETEDWFFTRGLRREYSLADLEQDRKTIAELFPELK